MHGLQRLLGGRHDRLPVLRVRLPDVDGDQLVGGGVPLGEQVEDRPVVAHERVLVVVVVDEGRRQAERLAEVFVQDPRLTAGGAVVDANHQVPAVLGDAAADAPLGLVRPVVRQHVVGLRAAEAVVVQLLVHIQRLELAVRGRLREPAVEEAFAVGRPTGRAELDPPQLVRQRLAGGDVEHLPHVPVGSRLGRAVGGVLAVVGRHEPGQGDGAVFGPLVRVEQHPGRTVEGVLGVQDALVLQPVVLGEEVPAADLVGRREPLVVPQLGHPPLDGLPLGQAVQVAEGDLVLGRHPVGHRRLLPHVPFEPAVRVGDGGAVVGVGLVHRFGVGILHLGRLLGDGHRGQRGEGDGQNGRSGGGHGNLRVGAAGRTCPGLLV